LEFLNLWIKNKKQYWTLEMLFTKQANSFANNPAEIESGFHGQCEGAEKLFLQNELYQE
jgi:hypothetical protein